MNLPVIDFRGQIFTNSDGTLTPFAQNYFDSLGSFFLKNLGNEGLISPTQNNSNATVIQNNQFNNANTLQYGTTIYNPDVNYLQVTLNNGSNKPIFYSLATVLGTISAVDGTASEIDVSTVAGVATISIDAGYIGQTSITTLGTITTGVWNGSIINPTYGGTGVNNGSSTITIGGNVTFSGAFTFIGNITANTNVTFPTSGTLMTTTGVTINGTANQITVTGTSPTFTLSFPSILHSANNTLDDGSGNVVLAGNISVKDTTGYFWHNSVTSSTQVYQVYSSDSGGLTFKDVANSLFPFTISTTGALTSLHNTLDDGGGGCSFATSGSDSVNIGTGLYTGQITIGNSSATLEIGSTISSPPGLGISIIPASGQPVTLGTNSNVVNINTSGSSAINIGTGSFSGTLSLGNGSSTLATLGILQINQSGSSNVGICAGSYSGTLTIGNSSITAINVTGAINNNITGSATINIATGSYSGTFNIGNSLSTLSTLGVVHINASGSSSASFGGGSYSGTLTIGNISGNPTVNMSGILNIGTAGSGAFGLGSGSYTGTLTIGNSSITAINITGAINNNTSGSSAINIGTSSYSGTMSLGNSSSTLTMLGTININNTGFSNTNINTVGGTLTIGTSSTFVGNAGNVAILSGAGNGGNFTILNNVTGTNSLTFGNDTGPTNFNTHGTININTSGASAINIGTGSYTGTITIGNSSLATNISLITTTSVLTKNNTLDNGSGAATIAGLLTASSGFTSNAYSSVTGTSGQGTIFDVISINATNFQVTQRIFNFNGSVIRGGLQLSWDNVNGVRIVDIKNNSVWLTQASNTSGNIQTLNNTLDDGSGNMTLVGTGDPILRLRRSSYSSSYVSRIRFADNNPGGFYWEIGSDVAGAKNNDLYFYQQGVGAAGTTLSLGYNVATSSYATGNALSSAHNLLDDGSGNMIIGNNGTITVSSTAGGSSAANHPAFTMQPSGIEIQRGYVTGSLTGTQCKTLHSSPVTILSAPGSGKGYLLRQVSINWSSTATAMGSGGGAIDFYINGLGYSSGASGTWPGFPASVLLGTRSAISYGVGAFATISITGTNSMSNQPIQISMASADFSGTTATGTLYYYVEYDLVSVS